MKRRSNATVFMEWTTKMKTGPFLTHARIGSEVFSMGDGHVGGIVTFVGTPRASSDKQKKVLYLEYEAYETMAEKLLSELVFQTREKWPLQEVFLRHRLGKVPVGEASVFLRVSSEHRREAFAACQFLIDGIKQEVPIWKREMYDDGSHAWVHCGREFLHDLI